MKRRLALSLLTVLALLWQGLSAAAMVPAMASFSSSSSGSTMSEHCRMMAAKAHAMDSAQPAVAAVKTATTKSDCCAKAGHCVCAVVCSAMSAALPSQSGLLSLPASASLCSAALPAQLAAAPPPHPFRPPIITAI